MDWRMPAGFWWLLAAIPLVALFLLKTRPRQRPVSTLRFWDQVLPEGPASRWLHRWRDRGMLLLNLLLLLLLVAALAEPVLRTPRDTSTLASQTPGGSSEPATDWVVVVDNSASLQASSGAITRWQLLLREFFASVAGASSVSILATTGGPPVVLPWTESRREVERTVTQLRPTDAPGRMDETLRLALQMAAARPAGRVRVFSDGSGHASTSTELRDACDWTTVGQASDNTAITQFQVRRSFADPLAFEAWVEVSQFADERLDATIELLRDGELLDVVPVSLDAGASWRKSWEHRASEGGVVSCRLVREGQPLRDALAVDNEARALLEPRAAVRVDLVTPGSVYLENVLRAIPWVELQVHRQLPASRPDRSVLVLHRTVPESLPPGKSLCVDVRESNAAWRSGAIVEDAEVAAGDDDSPWLRHVDLRDSQLAGVRELEFTLPASTLLSTLGGAPIYALLHHDQGTTLVLNLDLEQGDLAWRTAFPLLVAEALRELQGEDKAFQAATPAGQMVRVPIALAPTPRDPLPLDRVQEKPSLDAQETLVSPSGSRRPLARSGNDWLGGPLEETGVWRRERSSQTPTGADRGDTQRGTHSAFAVNLVSASESDLRPPSAPQAPALAGALGGFPLWKWLVLAVLAVSGMEWFLYQRRYLGS